MSRPPFDQWAKSEIAHLRGQADALQRALDLYLEANHTAQGAVTFRERPVTRERSIRGRQPRISKYEAAFLAFERAGKPLTLDEMIEIARREGLEIDRNNMRSQVFAQKQIGRTRLEGDGYIWRLQEIETTPSLREGAV